MSKNTNDLLLDDLEEIEKRSLFYRYLQNPFSINWSKLAALVQSERFSNQSEALNFANPNTQSGILFNNKICTLASQIGSILRCTTVFSFPTNGFYNAQQSKQKLYLF